MIFITNVPSFYKIFLYNEINKKRDVYVLFNGKDKCERNSDFSAAVAEFKFDSLAKMSFGAKLKFLIRLIKGREEVVIGGWDHWFNWIAAFLSPRRKNSVVVESSYLESTAAGIKGVLKRIFLSRISKAYCSGQSNVKLMYNLGFNGTVTVTGGVGVYRRQGCPVFTEKKIPVKNFLYVGRLASEKNLNFLIKLFNALPEYTLNIVGFGNQEEELKAIAAENIKFLGAVPNAELSEIYKKNDVFILFSKSEPWGLVIEEAMNNGLPVIVSDHVGCAEAIVKNGENGFIVPLDDSEALKQKIFEISDLAVYNRLRKNVCSIDFFEIERKQIECYLK